jgi:hypothetical protein
MRLRKTGKQYEKIVPYHGGEEESVIMRYASPRGNQPNYSLTPHGKQETCSCQTTHTQSPNCRTYIIQYVLFDGLSINRVPLLLFYREV